MAPRPFPYPFRVGIDICKINRIRVIIDPPPWSTATTTYSSHTSREEHETRPHKGPSRSDNQHRRQSPSPSTSDRAIDRFLKRLFTPRELVYFRVRFLDDGEVGQICDNPSPTSISTSTSTTCATANDFPQTPSAQFQSIHALSETRKNRIMAFVAGRWAAKESCIKAVKPRKLVFSEVEIWPDESGSGEMLGVVLDKSDEASTRVETGNENGGKVAREEHGRNEGETITSIQPLQSSYANLSGQILRVSISHDKGYACAVAIYASEEERDQVLNEEGRKGDDREEDEFSDLKEEVKSLRSEIEVLKRLVGADGHGDGSGRKD